MKKSLAFVAAAAIFSLGASVAFAQSIELAPEVQTSFHEFVTTAKVTPAMVDAELAVGATVPEGVTLSPVPAEIIGNAPELEGHEFFVVNDKIHVVDPATREIVTVID